MKLYQILFELTQSINFNLSGYGSWINPFTNEFIPVRNKQQHLKVAEEIVGELPSHISVYGTMFDKGYVRAVHQQQALFLSGTKESIKELIIKNAALKDRLDEIIIDIEDCSSGRCNQLANQSFSTAYQWSQLQRFLQ